MSTDRKTDRGDKAPHKPRNLGRCNLTEQRGGVGATGCQPPQLPENENPQGESMSQVESEPLRLRAAGD